MNENTNAVREAQYAKEKAEYDAAMLRHRELMSRRAAAKRGELHEQFAVTAAHSSRAHHRGNGPCGGPTQSSLALRWARALEKGCAARRGCRETRLTSQGRAPSILVVAIFNF